MRTRTRTSPPPPRLPALGLAWRLFAAVGLVVLAGAGTMLVAVLLVAEPAFHSHLAQVQPPMSEQAHSHVDEAFASAVLIALAVGVVVALAAALVVTWLVAKRLTAPVAEAADAAYRVADGDFETRLPQPGLGPELDRLTAAFNAMAHRLATTEQTRRRLLTDLAHELRTPLASMQATIEAMADGILPTDQTTLATLTEQSQRLHRLVGDLSAVSRAEERQLNLRPVVVPIHDLVTAAVSAARPRFDAKGINLTSADQHPAGGGVLVDPDRLGEALDALLDNALRHTPHSGAVSVDITGDNHRYRIVVTDNGEGFDPDLAARLFERFYRGDTSRTANGAGSGIGLTIAKAIVEAHHGQLHGHSDGPGSGARFEITLPIAGRGTPPPQPRGSATG
ncbi:MAG TPA: HAMP domain-containing sensor histidine kinase [Dermatophilaceae bacterium]|nr:HAMP domain-containing sensor histidine kinase [Dermatophilaceae bacterium]